MLSRDAPAAGLYGTIGDALVGSPHVSASRCGAGAARQGACQPGHQAGPWVALYRGAKANRRAE
jgi:hypothetical protein